MDTIRIIAGPLIGAVIGYFTNFIAVKMLFRPLHEVKIGNFRFPFTPGIIPKGKDRLAGALGKAVGENLLTKEDLEKIVLSDAVKNTVADTVMETIASEKNRNTPVKELLTAYIPPADYMAEKEHLENLLCDKMLEGIEKLDIVQLMNEESKRVVGEKLKGSFFESLISDDLIESLTSHIGVRVERYVRENGRDWIFPLIDEQAAELEQKTIHELAETVGVKKEQVRTVVEQAYTHAMQEKVSDFAEQFHIREMVEEKVRQMDVLEVEELVLSVMKNELNTIVNLGALIGLLIGILNVFI